MKNLTAIPMQYATFINSQKLQFLHISERIRCNDIERKIIVCVLVVTNLHGYLTCCLPMLAMCCYHSLGRTCMLRFLSMFSGSSASLQPIAGLEGGDTVISSYDREENVRGDRLPAPQPIAGLEGGRLSSAAVTERRPSEEAVSPPRSPSLGWRVGGSHQQL